MFEVKEKENYILKEALEAKRAGRKLFIYGAGDRGECVYNRFCENMIMADGFCVDTEYYKEGRLFCGLPVVSIDSLWGG